MKKAHQSAIAVISLLVSVVGAAVAVWGALDSRAQYDLAVQLAEEQRFVAIPFDIDENCNARVGPLPEPAHLQDLQLTIGDGTLESGPRLLIASVTQVDQDLGLQGVLAFAFADMPARTTQPIPEGYQATCDWYGGCGGGPMHNLPVLAHYEVELHGVFYEYWALLGLRITDGVFGPRSESRVTCQGLGYLRWFDSETEAKEVSERQWAAALDQIRRNRGSGHSGGSNNDPRAAVAGDGAGGP